MKTYFYRSCVVFIFTSLLLFTAHAQGTKPFSIADVMSSPFPSGLTASPPGKTVAWVFNQEGVRNIWMARLPELKGRSLTGYKKDDGQAISNLIITPDESAVIYVRGGNANRKGEIPNPLSRAEGTQQAIFRVSTSGGTPELLAEGKSPALSPDGTQLAFIRNQQVFMMPLGNSDEEAQQLFQVRGSAGSLAWSPDADRPKLAFTSNRGDHGYVGVFNFTDESITYLNPSVDKDRYPVWSPDGSALAFMRFPNEKQRLPFTPRRKGLPWSIWVANMQTMQAQQVWKAKPGTGSSFRNVSAGNQLMWAADNQLVFPYEGDGWTHLYALNASGGTARLLTPGNFEVQFVSLGNDRETVIYSSNQADTDRQHVWQVPVNGGSPTAITSGNGIEWSPLQLSGGTVVVLASSGTRPAYPAVVSGKGKLGSMAPGTVPNRFPTSELVEPEQVIFTAADGMKIHGQLFKPDNMKKKEQRPALIFFHGGSRRQMLLGFHHRGYYHKAYAMNQYLASQGYVVLAVNYRSGIGYGMEFREAMNYGAQGASEYQDVIGAGLYLQSRPDVDGEKIGLWGGSYGGYLTALGLARGSALFAAGVDLHGVHHWNVVIRNFVPSYQPEKREAFARLAYESSPMAAIEGWKSPVLLIHGDDDRNVPFSETVNLAEALRRQNVYFEQLVFPDEVHGFLLHKNWLAAYRASADFFNRMLQEDSPVSME